MSNPQAGRGLASRLEALVSYPRASSRRRERSRRREEPPGEGSPSSPSSPSSPGTPGGCPEECQCPGEAVCPATGGEEVRAMEDSTLTSSVEDVVGMEELKDDNFHPSLEELVGMIEESGVLRDREAAAQLHFVISYFLRVTAGNRAGE